MGWIGTALQVKRAEETVFSAVSDVGGQRQRWRAGICWGPIQSWCATAWDWYVPQVDSRALCILKQLQVYSILHFSCHPISAYPQ